MSASTTKIASLRGWGDAATHLAAWGDADLHALADARPELAQSPPRSFAALAERLAEPAGAQATYRRLDRAAQQVVDALSALGGAAELAELAAAIAPGVSAEALQPPLGTLEGAGLALVAGGSAVLNPGLSGMHRRAGLGPSLLPALQREQAIALTEMCRRLGAKAGGGGKAASVRAIVEFFATPGKARALLKQAPAGTAALVAQAARGQQVSVPGGVWSLDDRRPAGWLARRGYLVAVEWYLLTMPAEVGLSLRGGHVFESFSASPPPLPATSGDGEAVDAAGVERAVALAHRAGLALEELCARPAKLLKDGGMAVREVRRVAKVVGASEREAARLLDLLVAAGLLWVDHQAGTALPTAAWDGWRRLAGPAQWSRLVAGWMEAPFHPSLAGEISSKDKVIPPVLNRASHPEAVDQRRAVLAALASLPPGSSAVPDAVVERVTWAAPLLWDDGPAPPFLLAAWPIEEMEVLGLAVGGALTGAGRRVAGGDVEGAEAALAHLLPAPVREIVVQADLTAVAAGALAPDVAGELEVMADVESRGAATVYRFTEQSLRRAFDEGRSAADIAGFLERHAARGVPQGLSYLVADLGRRHGQLRVGRVATYVRCDDVALLAEVSQGRATARLKLRRLAPTVAITDAEPADVLAALRGAGYLPMEEDSGGGVVLSRPPEARAAARPAFPAARPSPLPGRPASANGHGGGTGGGLPAAAAVVAALRAGGGAKAASSKPTASQGMKGKPAAKKVAPARPAAPPPPELFEVESSRPTTIAKDLPSILALARQAADEEWLVRFSSTNTKGVTKQVNAWVLAVSPTDLLVEALPDYTSRTLNALRIHWARVLTEAEEEQLL